MKLVRLISFSALCLPVLSVGIAAAETAGGVTWKAPTSWKVDPPRQMRVVTYKVAPTKGDSDEAEVAVFYFGQGQGGTVEDNFKRWSGQFQDSKPAVTKDEKVATFAVHRIEVKGTYGGGMGPAMGGGAGAAAGKTGYELLGAIVEAPEGSVFFKLTGPQKTVEAARAAFDKMLKSMTK